MVIVCVEVVLDVDVVWLGLILVNGIGLVLVMLLLDVFVNECECVVIDWLCVLFWIIVLLE